MTAAIVPTQVGLLEYRPGNWPVEEQHEAVDAVRMGMRVDEVTVRVGMDVPAVQAPDSSLNYFVDETPDQPTLFEADFVLIGSVEQVRTDLDASGRAGR